MSDLRLLKCTPESVGQIREKAAEYSAANALEPPIGRRCTRSGRRDFREIKDVGQFPLGGEFAQQLIFIGINPDRMLVKSRAFADDLARIAAGDAPTPADLVDAQFLDNWLIGVSLQPILCGSVVDDGRNQ
ncbi:hypothetical protein [Methylosinus sporium]|uniref:hypothetical protein n=1 Tax=Methylosinus sporium TaxID=428 RepID=UPI00383BC0A2